MQTNIALLNSYEPLEESNRYQQLVQGLPAAVYVCDAQGYVKLYNKAAVTLWGREPEIGKDLWCGSWRIYHTDGTPLPLDSCPMAVTLREGRPVTGQEIIIERPDGVRRNILPHPKLIYNAAGIVIEAVNMLVDITDHKHTEQALRESEERFRTMADQAPIIILMSDENNKEIYVNKKWSEFTGRPVEEGHETGWTTFIHPEDRPRVIQEWQKAFQQREWYTSKFRYKNDRDEYHVLHANGVPRINARGEFMGYTVILYDITLQENAKVILERLIEERTKKLKETNTELERSNHELEQYAYIVSHDLQEPLRKIRTFADRLTLRYTPLLDADAQLTLDKIVSSAKRMSGLIHDLLNLSRLAKKGESFSKTDLNEILKNIKNDFELGITQKNAIILNDPLPVIDAIPLQINQLFHNLISNSLKFSSTGVQPVITISCRTLTKQEVSSNSKLNPELTYCEIVFKDNGIGFNEKYAEQIFVIFNRLSEGGIFEGSGIGLALCRKIVTNHGGEIYALSKEKEGASFYILLPVQQTKN